MGKKGNKKASKPPQPPTDDKHPKEVAAEEKKGRKARGHRQKGAGTVVSSKGEVQAGGLTIKEWQRTPQQLLLEYTQRQKRPKPKYKDIGRAPTGGGVRTRVILQDAKKPGTDRDLIFVPRQGFENATEARHAVALLALHHLTPLLPLEQKLPEPYKSMWLTLVRDGGEKKTTSSSGAVAAPSSGGGGRRGRSREPKESSRSPSSTSSKARKRRGKSADSAQSAFSESWDKSGDEDESRSRRSKGDALETVREISLVGKYVSAKERNAAREARENQRRQRANQRAAREATDPNKPPVLYMDETARAMVEAVVSVEAEEERKEEGDEANEDVHKYLRRQGFEVIQIDRAVAQVGKSIDRCIEWLCVNLPEDRLPEAFSPRGREGEIILGSSALERWGVRPLDARTALSREEGDEKQAGELVQRWIDQAWERAGDRVPKELAGEADDTMAPAEDSPDEELDAIDAIFGEDAKVQVVDSWRTIRVPLEQGKLCIIYKIGASYPLLPPQVWVESSDPPSVRLAMSAAARAWCRQNPGRTAVFELSSLLTEHRKTIVDAAIPQLGQILSPGHHHKTSEMEVRVGAPTRRKKGRFFGSVLKNSRPLRPARLAEMDAKNASMHPDGNPALLAQRRRLPAWSQKEQVVRLVRENAVTLVDGATGSGKSTQVPQFILEDMIRSGSGGRCRIVCTQPRRIAAVGLAQRVADERGAKVGEEVGYHVRGDRKGGQDTNLMFCTTGILLRQMMHGGLDDEVTHVIVDEVHERSVDTDFLLAVLRRLVPLRPSLRVILMSATMDARTLAKYFERDISSPPAIVQIPGRTFPVKELFASDLIEDFECSWKSSTHHRFVAEAIRLIVDNKGPPESHSSSGAILVFLPGVPEIRTLHRYLQNGPIADQLHILRLHGGLTPSEQSQVFRPPPSGKRKLVLSTNVAETSVTIDDVICVVDTGRVKEITYDAVNRLSRLEEQWASRAALTQRKGRAGRVQAGVCVRMFPSSFWDRFDEAPPPEMHRTPLERVCLTVMALGLGDATSFLRSVLDPPPAETVAASMRHLDEMGAVEDEEEEEKISEEEDGRRKRKKRKGLKLSALGMHLARIPLDVRLAKAVVFGCLLRCADPVLNAAAGLAERSPFRPPPPDARGGSNAEWNAVEEERKKNRWGLSDHLTLARTVTAWLDARGGAERRSLCDRLGLSYEGMRVIAENRKDFQRALSDAGFDTSTSAANIHSNDPSIIRAALCAGLYPQLAHVVYPSRTYDETVGGAVARDFSAREARLYIRIDPDAPELTSEKVVHRRDHDLIRVFLHPSSSLFHTGEYPSPYLSFFETSQSTKVWLRDASMVPTWALALFGGRVHVDKEKGEISLEPQKFVRFRAPPRIGLLVRGMHRAIHRLLEQKIQHPELDIGDHPVSRAMIHLVQN